MKITFDIVILLRPFALTASSGHSSTENQNLKKITQMHVNLEHNARKYKSAIS